MVSDILKQQSPATASSSTESADAASTGAASTGAAFTLVPQPPLGHHWLADLVECRYMPSTAEELQQLMERAAIASGATVVQSCFHRFSPYGLSGVVVIAESHLAVHTWPEHRTVCIDMFSCSTTIDAAKAIEIIQSAFQATSVQQSQHSRAALRGPSR